MGPRRRDPDHPDAPPPAGQLRKTVLQASQVREAADLVRQQAHIWGPREIAMGDGYRIRWQFEHRVEATSDLTPVHDYFRSEAGSGPFIEDERNDEQRSHESMWREARARGCDNVVIVHKQWADAVTTRQDPSLAFRVPRRWQSLTQDIAGNVIHVGLERLRGEGNGTIAHEMGHCMGLGHQPAPEQVDAQHRIMFPTLIPGVDRQITDSDLIALDAALDAISPSDGVLFSSPRPARPALRRSARRRRHHAP